MSLLTQERVDKNIILLKELIQEAAARKLLKKEFLEFHESDYPDQRSFFKKLFCPAGSFKIRSCLFLTANGLVEETGKDFQEEVNLDMDQKCVCYPIKSVPVMEVQYPAIMEKYGIESYSLQKWLSWIRE